MQKKILAASVAAALAFALPVLAQGQSGGAEVEAGVNTGAEAGTVTEGRPTAGNAPESTEGKANLEGKANAESKANAEGQIQAQPRDLTPQEKKRVAPRTAKNKSNTEGEGKRQN